MLATIAFRNIWRNRRRTLLTLSAMVVSLALLILALGVFSGMFADMLSSATEQYYGHLVISAEGYQDDREMFSHFADDGLEGRLPDGLGVRGASPRLRGFGLLSATDNTFPVEVLGVRPSLDGRVTTLAERLQDAEPSPAKVRVMLAAGQLPRIMLNPRSQADLVETVHDAAAAVVGLEAAIAQRDVHIR